LRFFVLSELNQTSAMTEAEPKALEPAFAEGDIEKNKGLS
jgi:hypothetical protein